MDFDQELRNKVHNVIGETLEVVLDGEKYYELLEKRFPIGLNRIEWTKIDQYRSKEIDFGNREIAKTEVLNFIFNVVKIADVKEGDEVVVLSDDALNNTYKMKFSVLLDCIDEIFFLPQHTYVLPLDANWCLNYTFENDLYFGFSPVDR